MKYVLEKGEEEGREEGTEEGRQEGRGLLFKIYSFHKLVMEN